MRNHKDNFVKNLARIIKKEYKEPIANIHFSKDCRPLCFTKERGRNRKKIMNHCIRPINWVKLNKIVEVLVSTQEREGSISISIVNNHLVTYLILIKFGNLIKRINIIISPLTKSVEDVSILDVHVYDIKTIEVSLGNIDTINYKPIDSYTNMTHSYTSDYQKQLIESAAFHHFIYNHLKIYYE